MAHSAETKRKISEALKGKPSYKRTTQLNESMSETITKAHINKPHWKQSISDKAKARWADPTFQPDLSKSDNHKKTIGDNIKSHWKRKEYADDIVDMLQEEIQCTNCGLTGLGGGMYRYHFDACSNAAGSRANEVTRNARLKREFG